MVSKNCNQYKPKNCDGAYLGYPPCFENKTASQLPQQGGVSNSSDLLERRVIDYLLEGGNGGAFIYKHFDDLRKLPQSDWAAYIIVKATEEALDLAHEGII
jgi:hypothetical protein